MTTYTINLTQVHSYLELHDHLMEVLPLPDYYGRNMDALWDSLHCWFDGPTTIEVIGADRVPQDLQETVRRLKLVLTDLCETDGVIISYL